MPDRTGVEQLEGEVWVGGLSRRQLMSCLSSRGILVNGHAETLLEDLVFDDGAPRSVVVTERTVVELGLPNGATLTSDLRGCSATRIIAVPGGYRALSAHCSEGQAESRDSMMSSGKAPEGGLTVAAEVLSQYAEYPKGFYLRVVDGQAWLRGCRCDDEHLWDDYFVFQLPPRSA